MTFRADKSIIKIRRNNYEYWTNSHPPSGITYVTKHPHANRPASLAFTLAEVLIVLGIIGLIADMTIPTLISNTQRKIAETRIQKFYSSMSQAIMLSEIDNGPLTGWDITNYQTSDDVIRVFNQYFAKYLSHIKAEKISYSLVGADIQDNAVRVYFNDSSSAIFKLSSAYIDIIYDVNSEKKPNKLGYDLFPFIINISSNTSKKGFKAYDYDLTYTTRTELLEKCKSSPQYCAVLIQHDGWQIKDDYPYKL